MKKGFATFAVVFATALSLAGAFWFSSRASANEAENASGSKLTCNTLTCPNGCCTRMGCHPGTANAACGADAVACVDCTALGQTCNTAQQCGDVLISHSEDTANINSLLSIQWSDNPTCSTYLADVFVVRAGHTWTVNEIDILGNGWENFPPAGLGAFASIDCYIYTDAGGKPSGYPNGSGAATWAESWAPNASNVTLSTTTDPYDSFAATLDNPPELGAGTYWLICAPSGTVASSGSWGPLFSADGPASPVMQWANPGGGWGTISTTWAAAAPQYSTVDNHFAFTLKCAADDDDDDNDDDDASPDDDVSPDDDDNDNDDNDNDDDDNDTTDDDDDNDDDVFGACCHGEFCSVAKYADCTEAWQGPDTTCSPNPCTDDDNDFADDDATPAHHSASSRKGGCGC